MNLLSTNGAHLPQSLGLIARRSNGHPTGEARSCRRFVYGGKYKRKRNGPHGDPGDLLLQLRKN